MIASGVSFEEIVSNTHFDPWFVQQMSDLMAIHRSVVGVALQLQDLDAADLRKLKQFGFSDAYIASLFGAEGMAVREQRSGSASRLISTASILAPPNLKR